MLDHRLKCLITILSYYCNLHINVGPSVEVLNYTILSYYCNHISMLDHRLKCLITILSYYCNLHINVGPSVEVLNYYLNVVFLSRFGRRIDG